MKADPNKVMWSRLRFLHLYDIFLFRHEKRLLSACRCLFRRGEMGNHLTLRSKLPSYIVGTQRHNGEGFSSGPLRRLFFANYGATERGFPFFVVLTYFLSYYVVVIIYHFLNKCIDSKIIVAQFQVPKIPVQQYNMSTVSARQIHYCYNSGQWIQ